MCGIAGILRFSRDAAGKKADDEKILQLLQHRGPDARSVQQEGMLTLYHTRLKIMDVSGASDQPFSDGVSGQTLIFNGEIFNYRELSRSLENLKTTGDTEVLYRLLQREGKS